MAKIITVTSGKGGVGKTTTTAALGAALARTGDRVAVVDFDVGLRNLDLVMGAERRVVYDLAERRPGRRPAVAGPDPGQARRNPVPAARVADPRQGRADRRRRRQGDRRVVGPVRLGDLRQPGGIERGATLAMRHCDIAVVVTNPEVSSVRDSDRIVGILDAKTLKAIRGETVDKRLLLTRYDAARAARGDMLKAEDVLEILSLPLLGIIPESTDVLKASNFGVPVSIHDPASAAAQAYVDAARRLKGENPTVEVPTTPRLGLFGKFPQEGGMSLWKKLFSTTGSAPGGALNDCRSCCRTSARCWVVTTCCPACGEDILAAVAKRVPCDRDAVKVRPRTRNADVGPGDRGRDPRQCRTRQGAGCLTACSRPSDMEVATWRRG